MVETNNFSASNLLRDVRKDDLEIFFTHQLDPEANHMAAFTSENPADRKAFMTHWLKIFGDEAIKKKTILYEGRVAGHVASFKRFGQPEVTYWLGREYWGKGLATRALAALLKDLPVRPMYARAAKDNIASIRVLEKCGFTVVGTERAFANARGEEVEEFILKLD
jgi:RimJ/RimL family protein N-acetyltransferase